MSRFLDLKTSQNASFANSIAIPITVINTNQLIAQQTLDLTLGVAGQTRVDFVGMMAIQLGLLPVATTVTISVVRGTLPTSPVIFSAAQVLDIALLGPQTISIAGSDFFAPNTVQTYTVFVSVTALGATRVGPESFNFIGSSDT
ncbi:hypothetical protein HGI30_04380 [Paenibacillus albicereus]|uniref:Uncharacterized protein n=1 Tax=Paenibacillus albicereus TaxID=2726185 RepID=A0A6H2GTW6_9BACL|nr:hypothetical protein [Paenibacillus albicereus]QJC50874.1 hypothetical protein HGI30_04380 [Paenibacillus albicereus]